MNFFLTWNTKDILNSVVREWTPIFLTFILMLLYCIYCNFTVNFFCIHADPVCTAHSNIGKEVLVGSTLTVSCFFNKKCPKIIFRDGEQIKHEQSLHLNVVSVDVKNLTKLSIFTCKCNKDPEPCGIDIAPGCKQLSVICLYFKHLSLFLGFTLYGKAGISSESCLYFLKCQVNFLLKLL